MEREYEFCGENAETGEIEHSNTINWGKWVPLSICEWTGLVDVEGEKIFESDYVVPLNYKGERLEGLMGRVVFAGGGWYVKRMSVDSREHYLLQVYKQEYYGLSRFVELADSGLPKNNVIKVKKVNLEEYGENREKI